MRHGLRVIALSVMDGFDEHKAGGLAIDAVSHVACPVHFDAMNAVAVVYFRATRRD